MFILPLYCCQSPSLPHFICILETFYGKNLFWAQILFSAPPPLSFQNCGYWSSLSWILDPSPLHRTVHIISSVRFVLLHIRYYNNRSIVPLCSPHSKPDRCRFNPHHDGGTLLPQESSWVYSSWHWWPWWDASSEGIVINSWLVSPWSPFLELVYENSNHEIQAKIMHSNYYFFKNPF